MLYILTNKQQATKKNVQFRIHNGGPLSVDFYFPWWMKNGYTLCFCVASGETALAMLTEPAEGMKI